MMAVSVEADATFSPGTPEVLFAAPYLTTEGPTGRTRPWDVAQNGRFLMVKEGGSGDGTTASPYIAVVQNWFEELKRLVPTN